MSWLTPQLSCSYSDISDDFLIFPNRCLSSGSFSARSNSFSTNSTISLFGFAGSWFASAAPSYQLPFSSKSADFRNGLIGGCPFCTESLSIYYLAHGKSSVRLFSCLLRHRQTYPARVYWFYWQVSGYPVVCWWAEVSLRLILIDSRFWEDFSRNLRGYDCFGRFPTTWLNTLLTADMIYAPCHHSHVLTGWSPETQHNATLLLRARQSDCPNSLKKIVGNSSIIATTWVALLFISLTILEL